MRPRNTRIVAKREIVHAPDFGQVNFPSLCLLRLFVAKWDLGLPAWHYSELPYFAISRWLRAAVSSMMNWS